MKETRQKVYTCDKYLVKQIEENLDTIILPNFCQSINIYSSGPKYLKSVYKIDKEYIDIQYADYETACKHTNLKIDYAKQANTKFSFSYK